MRRVGKRKGRGRRSFFTGGYRGCSSTEQPRAKSLGLVRCLLEWLNNSGNSSDVKVIDRLFLFAYARACVCEQREKNICRIRKCIQCRSRRFALRVLDGMGAVSVFPPAATCEPLTSRLIFLFVYIITAAT